MHGYAFYILLKMVLSKVTWTLKIILCWADVEQGTNVDRDKVPRTETLNKSRLTDIGSANK